MYLFSNVLGVFVFDDKLNKVDEILFKTFEDSQNKKNPQKNHGEPSHIGTKTHHVIISHRNVVLNFML